MTTTQKLNESARLLRAGRDIQRRLNLRIIRARIADLRADPNDLASKLVADELDELVLEISAAAK